MPIGYAGDPGDVGSIEGSRDGEFRDILQNQIVYIQTELKRQLKERHGVQEESQSKRQGVKEIGELST
jgi:hypothetical protein